VRAINLFIGGLDHVIICIWSLTDGSAIFFEGKFRKFLSIFFCFFNRFFRCVYHKAD